MRFGGGLRSRRGAAIYGGLVDSPQEGRVIGGILPELPDHDAAETIVERVTGFLLYRIDAVKIYPLHLVLIGGGMVLLH